MLAHREGNPPVTSWFPSQRTCDADFDISFGVSLNKQDKNSNSLGFETPGGATFMWRNYNVHNDNNNKQQI